MILAVRATDLYREQLKNVAANYGHHRRQCEIYTDWANHYLERAKFKSFIQDLQGDVCDGVILADVIEAVTGNKVQDVLRKPKGQSQMLDNIGLCLKVLVTLGVNVDGITSKDIKEGNLRAILGLFFSLSRYKQAQKAAASIIQQQQRLVVPSSDGDMTSKLPSPFKQSANRNVPQTVAKETISSIPTPSTANNNRRSFTSDRTPRNSFTPSNGIPCSVGLTSKGPSNNSSRSGSPQTSNSTSIPQPRNGTVRSNPSSRPTSTSSIPQLPSNNVTYRNPATLTKSAAGQHSMLDKLKFFNNNNNKDKDQQRSKASGTTTASKRTSSSSGFSSARSERSDSSASLCDTNKANPATTPASNSPKITRSLVKKPFTRNQHSTTNTKAASKEETSVKNVAKEPAVVDVKATKDHHQSTKEMDTQQQDSSGIPKPTAAVKGTSKPPKEVPAKPSPVGTKLSRDEIYVPVHIAGPETQVVVDTPADQQRLQMIGRGGTTTDSWSSRSGRDGNVAMVSPIMSRAEDASPPDPAESSLKDSVDSNNTKDSEESDEVMINIKPMQPILRASHYGYMRNLNTGGGGYRGLQTGSRLALQGSSRCQFLASASGDPLSGVSDHHQLASGYLSDGEVLRPAPIGRERTREDEIASGYMSEGGASLYGRKVRVKEDNKIINVLQDDSFDDSSSVSSGISDTINEFSTDDNLTGSSVSSETNPYSSLKRPPPPQPPQRDQVVNYHHHKTATSEVDASRKVNGEVAKERTINRGGSSTSSRSDIKKTDSSMQTDSSAFVSTAAWKKYLQHHELHLQAKEQQQQQRSKSKNPPSSTGSSGSGSKKTDAYKVQKQQKLSLAKEGSCESLPLQSKKSSSSSNRPAVSPSGAGGVVYIQASSKRSVANGSVVGSSKSSRSSNKSSKQTSSVDVDVNCSPTPAQLASSRGKSTLERKTTKVKVSANTQTTVHDLYGGATALSDSEYSSLGRNKMSSVSKQYFLTSPTLGLGRERIYARGMLNGSPTLSADYVTFAGLQSLTRPRLSIPYSKGCESDNYVTLDHTASLPSSSPTPYSWIRPGSSSAASVASAPTGRIYSGGLTEAESMESISSATSSAPTTQVRPSSSLTLSRLTVHQASPRLSRSNSIRSTKSENLYPSILRRSSEDLPPPTSSTPTSQGSSSRYLFPLSPVNPMMGTTSISTSSSRSSATMPHYMGSLLSKMASKDDDVHGSSLSLVSTSSSLYSTAEEKQAHEIRKLKRELDQAHEKVATLTSQLTTNAHMVAAFEQSLSNMTSRLQHLTASAEQKDSELSELRGTIEALKKQSAEAGLTKVALQSMQTVQRSTGASHLLRRHTFNTTKDTALQEHRISRQLSTDSVSSVNSLSSGTSLQSGECSKKKKKKGWLRSSFSKAFSRSKKNRNGSVSDVEDPRQFQSDSSTPNSPLLGTHHLNGHAGGPFGGIRPSNSSSASICEQDDEEVPEDVTKLKRQLREKDIAMTDIRLDALNSAHKLESLREMVNRMKNEMLNLKQDNDRLQRLVTAKSLASSQSSLPMRNSLESLEKRLSNSEHSETPSIDLYLNDAVNERDGKRVVILAYFGFHGDYSKYTSQNNLQQQSQEVFLGSVLVSGKTKWDLLDNVVKRTFKEYVLRVDPASNLGLNAESVLCYHIGDILRSKESDTPELLPYGYLVGENVQIKVVLKGSCQNAVDALAFETLIPKSIVQRYVSLLVEHRRIILCGPTGTGKSFLAQKLAEFLVLRSGKDVNAGAIATFSVDHKSAKELRQYLSNVADQCESSVPSDLPTVIILDNLHLVGSLGEVFNGFLSAKYQKCPFIIGTMNQATCSTTNLQLHHNFRWVLCASHMEPIKGFLGRFLRRKLVEEEVRSGTRHPELTKVIDWMPKCWQNLNKFLETHSSSDVTIGPRLFLSCPLDVNSSLVWFTDLWNYSIVPYLLDAVREGLQLYGRRAPWEDPAEWVTETYPWPTPGSAFGAQLLRMRPEDVGYEGHPGPGGGGAKTIHSSASEVETDPLLNMLMQLQEAATYSSPLGNDSDSLKLDRHHTDDLLSSGIESTL